MKKLNGILGALSGNDNKDKFGGIVKKIWVKDHKIFIAVGTNEKGPAHFHVFRSEEDLYKWDKSASILLSNNKYFIHPNHSNIKLSDNELDEITSELKLLHPTLHISYWKFLLTLWNEYNEKYSINTNIKIPDFILINKYK